MKLWKLVLAAALVAGAIGCGGAGAEVPRTPVPMEKPNQSVELQGGKNPKPSDRQEALPR